MGYTVGYMVGDLPGEDMDTKKPEINSPTNSPTGRASSKPLTIKDLYQVAQVAHDLIYGHEKKP